MNVVVGVSGPSENVIFDLSSNAFCPASGAPTATVVVNDRTEHLQTSLTACDSLGGSWNQPSRTLRPTTLASARALLESLFSSTHSPIPWSPWSQTSLTAPTACTTRFSVLQGLWRRVRFTVDTTAAHQALEGSDEFVNYCIDQSQTVYSENGRLYCNVPAASYVLSLP